MKIRSKIIIRIKNVIKALEPNAKVILFGSYARGDNKNSSDIDLLILLDKDRITVSDEKRITYPLYDIEFDTGKLISPLLFSKKEWESRHRITPLYENIKNEGIEL